MTTPRAPRQAGTDGDSAAVESSERTGQWTGQRIGAWIGEWSIERVATTASTNADLAARAAQGARSGTVLVADEQTAGRGRHGRRWVAPPGTALMFSVLLRPHRVPPARRGWVGALLGMAVARGIEQGTGVRACLKWPNDVLVGPDKVAGVLAEMVDEALVAGVGINVTSGTADLPSAEATSLLLAGADRQACDRHALLAAILGEFAVLLERWQHARGDMAASGLRADYLALSATVGHDVTIHLPDGRTVTGTAIDVASDGNIVIDDGVRRYGFAAGDVRHLRRGRPAVDLTH